MAWNSSSRVSYGGWAMEHKYAHGETHGYPGDQTINHDHHKVDAGTGGLQISYSQMGLGTRNAWSSIFPRKMYRISFKSNHQKGMRRISWLGFQRRMACSL
jgi:hypothetical protein